MDPGDQTVTPELRDLLRDLHREGRAHDAGHRDRRDRLRNLEPETGALLHLLIHATGARRVLEVGTSNGYSALWLGDALRATGGRLESVDVDAGRLEAARANVARGGLQDVVALRQEDGGAALAAAEEDAYDLVFLDAERDAYAGWWPALRRVVRPGGLVAADNAISHAHELMAFRALLREDEGVVETLDGTGAGLLLATLVA
ncbi:class I SAM-dependent methyltransferase [Patulibacter sp. SYSU D01012]|uniref:O-methyltransferase n=1 Tax=Patulibacter sp. SYSU D01012 TaxID=2817381 RepID=UPI001B311186